MLRLLLRVPLFQRDHLAHLGLLLHSVRLLLTDLRHLKVQRLRLDQRYPVRLMCRMDRLYRRDHLDRLARLLL